MGLAARRRASHSSLTMKVTQIHQYLWASQALLQFLLHGRLRGPRPVVGKARRPAQRLLRDLERR